MSTPSKPVRVSATELESFIHRLFVARGMSSSDAATVAEVLTWASVRGIDSHGVAIVPRYFVFMQSQGMDPRATLDLAMDMKATFLLKCNGAAGAVAMMRGVALAVERAAECGTSIGFIRDTTHTGAVGRYAHWAAERGFATYITVAGPPLMAYHGTKAASLSTSPITIGVPRENGEPLVLDMATSIIANSKLRVAAARGEQLPEGSALTASGEPTTDATEAVIPLPLGGPKGSGISFMTEIVNSVMTGSPILANYRRADGTILHRQNAMIIAFKVEAFRSLADFNRDLETEIAMIRALPLAEGVDAVRLPGERSGRVAIERRRDGIPMPGKLWDDTLALARGLDVAPPATL